MKSYPTPDQATWDAWNALPGLEAKCRMIESFLNWKVGVPKMFRCSVA